LPKKRPAPLRFRPNVPQGPVQADRVAPPPPLPRAPHDYNRQPFLPPLSYHIQSELRDQLMPFVNEFGCTNDRFSYACAKSRLNFITLQ
jgi:hypothetical protein